MEDSEVLEIARKRFQNIQTAESHIRDAALEDLKFVYNVEEGQWDETTKKEREADNRPCLTANKLRKFVAQVANKEKDARMAIKVIPVDDKADIATASVLQDLIRQIEYNSNQENLKTGAEEIYTSVAEKALAGGFGYWRILTREMDDGFDQEIVIEEIDNQFSVYFDPRGNYCFIREGMTKDEFEAEYPDTNPIDFDLSSKGEEYSLWYEKDKVFIAEYFTKESTTKEIVQAIPVTVDPETNNLVPMGEPQIFELKKGITKEELEAQGYKVLKNRKVKTHKIMWYKMTGTEILEKQEWSGKYIPVIEVLGDRVNIEGKVYKRSLTRDAKDPQRMYNYWLTSITEKVALVPKAPFIVTPQEIAGYENMWKGANRRNEPYLLFNAHGQRIPQRQAPAQIETGAVQMLQVSDDDIKDTIGMYEPTVGEISNERSGRAMEVRAFRSDTGVYHFPNNLKKAIIQTARILIDLIPKIYDNTRIIRIRGYDEKEMNIKINEPVIDMETGKIVILNNLSVGKYDVIADVRVFSTRRQETVQLLTSAMQYAPAVAPLLVDLVFKYTDSPGAEEITKRIEQYLSGQTPLGKGGEIKPVSSETGQPQGRA